MDKIQKVLVKAGRKDLAIEYYNKIAGKIKGPGIPDGTGPMKDSEECPYKKEEKEAAGKCPEEGCIGKKPNGKWGVMSNKTGKWWDADYDTKEDAEDALKAYHVQKGGSKTAGIGYELYAKELDRVSAQCNTINDYAKNLQN